eukprot:6795920-Prymnesium_polylepis.1
MHPGGTRTISLQNTKVGGFQLAKIVGGGGVGEPESFELPAMVNGASITIDFSPYVTGLEPWLLDSHALSLDNRCSDPGATERVDQRTSRVTGTKTGSSSRRHRDRSSAATLPVRCARLASADGAR